MASQDRSDQEIFETLQAAEALAQRLRALMGSVGPDFVSTQFYTRIRVKSYDSIIKKIYAKRRRPGGELYSFNDITDLVGFRIVTLYDDDINNAIDHLLKLIEDSSGFDQPLFKPFKPLDPNNVGLWDYIREASFIRRIRTDETRDIYELVYDRVVERLKTELHLTPEVLNHHLRKFNLREPVAEGYSSIHLVINGVSKLYNRESDIAIEVQIRTAAEDIWGEMNHQLLYKVQSLFVWTPSIQQAYTEMEDDSRFIKKQLYELRDPITRFWQHSTEAGRLINDFRRPTTPYHRSLIVTLFYAISGEFLGNVEPLLREYDETLAALTQTVHFDQAATILFNCLRLVAQVRGRFEESLNGVLAAITKYGKNHPRALDNQSTLLTQRMLLCNLEIARLKALAVIRFNHVIDPKVQIIDPDREKDEIQLVFNTMCDIRNSSDLKIRPVAMMSFWKYIIGRKIDHQLGIYHLRSAVDEMEQDSSLPEWSIYRIVIPRYLAAELYDGAKKLVRDNGRRPSRNIWWRSQLAIDVRNMLNHAFELALQSHEKHLQRDDKSGDLVFGYEVGEEIRDADVIANVTSLYFTLFDSPDYQRLGTSAQFIFDRVSEVYEFFTNMPSRDSRRIERLRKTLDRLSADIR